MIKLCAFADEATTDLMGQIQALKRNDIEYLELRSINGKNVKDFTISEAETYEKILSENGIRVWSIGSPLGKVDIHTDFEQYQQTVRKLCKIANIFKTDKIRMFSFHNAYDDKELVFSYLRKMVEIAKEYGIELYHENEKDVYGDIAERVAEIMENVSGLRYIYDPANYIQCNQKADKTLEMFHNKTDYFHIKDVIEETGELVPAGYGSGKIEELINRITTDKVLTMEPHLAVFDGYASIDNTKMKHKFHFANKQEAFDVAVHTIKELLKKCGYKEVDKAFIK